MSGFGAPGKGSLGKRGKGGGKKKAKENAATTGEQDGSAWRLAVYAPPASHYQKARWKFRRQGNTSLALSKPLACQIAF